MKAATTTNEASTAYPELVAEAIARISAELHGDRAGRVDALVGRMANRGRSSKEFLAEKHAELEREQPASER